MRYCRLARDGSGVYTLNDWPVVDDEAGELATSDARIQALNHARDLFRSMYATMTKQK